MPERFDLSYIGADGQKHRPIVIHRVIFGSIERFIAILTEHSAGVFPLWLAPVQAKFITVNEEYDAYALAAKEAFDKAGIRTEIDLRNEKLGYKIREAQMEKVPYMFVIGSKEQESGTLNVRSHGRGDMGAMLIEDQSVCSRKK
jgi:threonyl-tRNA synthetase